MPEETALPTPETPPLSGGYEETSLSPEAKVVSVETQPEMPKEHVAEKYANILSKVKSPATGTLSDDANITADADSFGDVTDAMATINKLVALAETKGVAHAVAVAKKLNDFYILDQMHDTLVDDLSVALEQKGLIRSE